MNYNLKQLEAFVAVVECGSFTAAADRLYLAQSTISAHVAALEKEIGVPLLMRSGKRRIILTEEGRRVYTHAKAILQSCEQLSRELEERNSQELVLAASTIPMGYLLPGMLAGFKRVMPQCRFTLCSGDSASVHELVLEGQAQIGFVGAVMNRKELVYDMLYEDKLMLLTPDTEKYREMKSAGISGNALLSEPLIFRELGSGTQQAVDKFLCENNIRTEDIHVVARMDNHDTILRAIAQGLGIAVVSELAARAAQNVISFPLEGKSTVRYLYMITPKNVRLTNVARSFREYVLNYKIV
ncbi:MAG: LysR family transcriptional regulator [Christensenellaceae bacterium]|nr:LysR family transcriptional regulator [Christensenellaceae bacterium]